MMVETRKYIVYPMMYLLLKLSLLLPVATPTTEGSFYAMNYVKNLLHNHIRGEFFNGCLVTYIKNDIFDTVENEKIIQHFQYLTSS